MIQGRPAYLKINSPFSSCAALVIPPPALLPSSLSQWEDPVYMSQLESGLCLEINKLAPLSAWNFPLSGNTSHHPRDERFPSSLWRTLGKRRRAQGTSMVVQWLRLHSQCIQHGFDAWPGKRDATKSLDGTTKDPACCNEDHTGCN